MKYGIFFVLIFSCSLAAFAAVPEKVIFGPEKYDVKERYGKDNVYRGSFKATEGSYVIKLQNGGRVPERSDFIQFTLNGQKLLSNARYDYGFIACVVSLQRENTFEVVVKDDKPSGLKRPPLPPRFVVMTVMPLSGKLPNAAYGINSWEALKDQKDLLQKITNPESASLAVTALNLQNDVATRSAAMRRLSDRKDRSAQPLILALFNDPSNSSEIRAEAARALGMLEDKTSIPVLINGILDPEEKTRTGACYALSLFKEEDTREPLSKMLEQLDVMRMNAVIRAMAGGGWKPVGTLMTLVENSDPYISQTAINLIANTRDPRATDLLLKLFNQPGSRDIRSIIWALGQTGDARALEPLSAMAKDQKRRAGLEAELGDALADLGNRQSVELIVQMIKKTGSRQSQLRLEQAYKRLTGKEYR